MAAPGTLRDLRPGERLPTFAMALAVALVLVAYYLIKPARDSLFLAHASPARLPWVYMLAALVAAPTATLHATLGRGRSLGPMTVGTILVLAATLPGLRFLVGVDGAWVPYLLYSWAGIVGALATSQLWLMAGVMFDAAQAKRVFPLLSVGAIVGAVGGGEATRWLVSDLGLAAADLLAVAGAVLATAAFLSGWIWRRWGGLQPKPPREEASSKMPTTLRTLRLVLKSRHLTLVVGLLAVAVVVTTFVDFQFKSIAWRAYPDSALLAGFLGRFYGLVSLASLVVQLVLSRRVMARFGVGGLVSALPVVLAFGSGALLVLPGLAAATLLRGGDLGLKHSLDRTGRELLLLPVPMELKRRTKLFIDVFVDRWFRGLAGGLLLLMTAVFGLSERALSIPVLVLIVGWIVLVILMRREYAETFRRALARREIDPTEIHRHLDDDDTAAAVSAALRSNVERRILYALTLAPAVKGLEASTDLEPLLSHGSAQVRSTALKVLGEREEPLDVERVRTMIADDDSAVRRAACGALAVGAGENRHAFLQSCLHDGSVRERNAAAGWIAAHGDDPDVELVTDADLDAMLTDTTDDRPESRRMAVRVLGRSSASNAADRLAALLDDSDGGLAKLAVKELSHRDAPAVRSLVVSRLSDRRLRAAAREALVAQGEEAVPDLVTAAGRGDPITRRQAVRALGALGGRVAVRALVDLVDDDEPIIRETALGALMRLRRDDPRLKLPAGPLTELHKDRLALYHGLVQSHRELCSGEKAEGPSSLLRRTLDEKISRSALDAFMLLALRYPPRDIRNAWFGIRRGDRHQRAGAAEFLEEILREPDRALMRPLTGDVPDAELRRTARREFGLDLKGPVEAWDYLMNRRDPWLRACAVHHAGLAGDEDLRRRAAERDDDPSPLVRETVTLIKAG